MKVGIYAKYLNTLGGGEKVACAMAETLINAGYRVDLVTSFDVERDSVEKAMGVDLKGVKFVVWYERHYKKLTPLTKKYDLFINVSYLDHLPSDAKRSIYFAHFPTPIRRTILGFIKYETILPYLRKFLIIPEIESGIQPIDDIFARGGRWMGNENTIVFSNAPEKFGVKFRFYSEQMLATTLNEVKFGSKDSEVMIMDKQIEHGENILLYKLGVSKLRKEDNSVININIDRDFDKNMIALVSLTVLHYRFLLWNIMKRLLPTYEMALYGSSSYKPAAGLDTYNLVLSNSFFTRKWVRNYWGKSSKVLYPPVDVDEFKPGEKKNVILTVGRFFVGGHQKNQHVLVDAFKNLYEKGKIDKSWEFHLVGGVATGKEHSDYMSSLKESAEGYPIYFHLFAPYDLLKNLYARAKIYWHATGYQIDKNKHPIKLEHFGIVVIESMAAGCVPLVYNAGGLTETVTERSGFTWNSKKELIKKTNKLIGNELLREQMSKYSIRRARNYSRERFSKKLLKHVKKMG